MKIVKLGIISIIVFALLITMISLFFPSQIRISKAIDISASKDSLMSNLSDPVKWKRWYPGGDSLEIRFAITDITDSTIISHKVGPFSRDMISGWNVYSTTRPNIYTVQWYMDFHLGWWPWDKFSGLLLEKRNGPAMEKGLDKLKKIMEQTDTTSIN